MDSLVEQEVDLISGGIESLPVELHLDGRADEGCPSGNVDNSYRDNSPSGIVIWTKVLTSWWCSRPSGELSFGGQLSGWDVIVLVWNCPVGS